MDEAELMDTPTDVNNKHAERDGLNVGMHTWPYRVTKTGAVTALPSAMLEGDNNEVILIPHLVLSI